MSLSKKLIITIVSVVFCAFSLGGLLMMANNFGVSLNDAVTQNTERWQMSCNNLRSRLISDKIKGVDYESSTVAQYARQMMSYAEKWELLIKNSEGDVVYSNLKDRKIASLEENSYCVIKYENEYYNCFSSSFEIYDEKLTLTGCFDITYVFKERSRQYLAFLLTEFSVVMLTGAAAFILSKRITSPLLKLNKTAKSIAGGEYERRTNITSDDEIGSLSKSFDDMVCRLENQINVKTAFVADFSHELKTPMTSIIGYADILRNRILSEEEKFLYADKIYKNGKRLYALEEKMLSLLEISQNKLVLKPVNVNDVKKELELIFDKNAEIIYELTPNISVLADKELLTTLLRNLIENALKACENSPVTLSGELVEGKYIFCVTDRGCGMDEKVLSKITEPFYKADKARNSSGFGVGLSICKSICNAFNTKLIFKSRPGEGTQVSFETEVCE